MTTNIQNNIKICKLNISRLRKRLKCNYLNENRFCLNNYVTFEEGRGQILCHISRSRFGRKQTCLLLKIRMLKIGGILFFIQSWKILLWLISLQQICFPAFSFLLKFSHCKITHNLLFIKKYYRNFYFRRRKMPEILYNKNIFNS